MQQLVLKITFSQWTSLKNYLFLLNLTQKLPFPTEALSKCLDVKQYSFKLKMSQGHEKKLIENFRVSCWYLKQPVDFCSLTQICSACYHFDFCIAQNSMFLGLMASQRRVWRWFSYFCQGSVTSRKLVSRCFQNLLHSPWNFLKSAVNKILKSLCPLKETIILATIVSF